MSDSRDNYLKIIYEEADNGIVSNKVIAEKLNVSPSSVSEMLSKLSAKGLVEIIPYKGCKLTESGFELCLDLVRIHRLWEVFLIENLGYTWREAHEDAHLLEHASTDRMIERLDKFLNYPKNCPHGSVIPQKNRFELKAHTLTKLSNLNKDEKAIISKIDEDGVLLDYLWDLGIKIGKPIKIISKEAYEGSIKLIQEGKEISISYKAAKQIYTEKEKE